MNIWLHYIVRWCTENSNIAEIVARGIAFLIQWSLINVGKICGITMTIFSTYCRHMQTVLLSDLEIL